MASRPARHPVFRECVERHFKTWSSLQLSLREVMPGPVGLEFFNWIMDATETFFYENADLYPDEVSDFLSEILNTELDTLIEDGSLEVMCTALCSAFRSCAAGREAEVAAELAKLPPPTDLAGCRQAAIVEEDEGGPSEPIAAAAAPAGAAASSHVATNPAPPESMQTEDGWTVVRKKR